MYFIDIEHEIFYKEKIKQSIVKDVYSNSLIYLLSSTKETRKYFEQIYDINRNEIHIEILKEPWQTNTSINTCRLAFNLFGDIVSDDLNEENEYLYTITSIFKNLNIDCCTEALKLRFG